jgi:hypothetical protein
MKRAPICRLSPHSHQKAPCAISAYSQAYLKCGRDRSMQLDSVFVREGPLTDGNSSPVGVRNTREIKEESADMLQCCRQWQDRCWRQAEARTTQHVLYVWQCADAFIREDGRFKLSDIPREVDVSLLCQRESVGIEGNLRQRSVQTFAKLIFWGCPNFTRSTSREK